MPQQPQKTYARTNTALPFSVTYVTNNQHGVNQHIIWKRINTSEFKGVTNTLKKLIKNNNFNLNFKHMISSNT
jgi:hypothetical protein